MRAHAFGQGHAKGVAVGHRFAGVVDAAGQQAARRRQRGFARGAFGARPDLAGGGLAGGLLEDLRGAVDHQLAGVAPVEFVGRNDRAELLHAGARQLAQFQQLGGGAAVRGGRALAEEAGQPGPLAQVGLRLEAQRAVFLEQPLDGLQRHAGVGQRRHVAVAQLAAIAMAGAARHVGRAVDQGHLVAGLEQPPGRGQADDTAADDNYLLHPATLLFADIREELRRSARFQANESDKPRHNRQSCIPCKMHARPVSAGNGMPKHARKNVFLEAGECRVASLACARVA